MFVTKKTHDALKRWNRVLAKNNDDLIKVVRELKEDNRRIVRKSVDEDMKKNAVIRENKKLSDQNHDVQSRINRLVDSTKKALPWLQEFYLDDATPYQRTKDNPNAYWVVAYKGFSGGEFYCPFNSLSDTKEEAIAAFVGKHSNKQERYKLWRSKKRSGYYLKRVVLVGVE